MKSSSVKNTGSVINRKTYGYTSEQEAIEAKNMINNYRKEIPFSQRREEFEKRREYYKKFSTNPARKWK